MRFGKLFANTVGLACRQRKWSTRVDSFGWNGIALNIRTALWGVKDEIRPLAVQIWDNEPETLAAVGQRLAREYGVTVVDINFGCPVRQVTEKGA